MLWDKKNDSAFKLRVEPKSVYNNHNTNCNGIVVRKQNGLHSVHSNTNIMYNVRYIMPHLAAYKTTIIGNKKYILY